MTCILNVRKLAHKAHTGPTQGNLWQLGVPDGMDSLNSIMTIFFKNQFNLIIFCENPDNICNHQCFYRPFGFKLII